MIVNAVSWDFKNDMRKRKYYSFTDTLKKIIQINVLITILRIVPIFKI